jgi:glyoxylase-like metal-dependent hydrolase (beta-lactamase superfamily II)
VNVKTYTGGLLDTNAYLIEGDEGWILIDAPEGAAEWLARSGVGKKGKKLAHLLLTHGHYDHMLDAARLRAMTGCAVWIHPDSAPLVRHPEAMLAMSPYPHIEAVEPDHMLEETGSLKIAGLEFRTFLCPGHCPGSICFYHAPSKSLFAGDVLFAGGVGRSDLPGGSFEQLRDAIQNKLYALPGDTRVYPGHGPATTIGMEKKTNPFVAGR